MCGCARRITAPGPDHDCVGAGSRVGVINTILAPTSVQRSYVALCHRGWGPVLMTTNVSSVPTVRRSSAVMPAALPSVRASTSIRANWAAAWAATPTETPRALTSTRLAVADRGHGSRDRISDDGFGQPGPGRRVSAPPRRCRRSRGESPTCMRARPVRGTSGESCCAACPVGQPAPRPGRPGGALIAWIARSPEHDDVARLEGPACCRDHRDALVVPVLSERNAGVDERVE